MKAPHIRHIIFDLTGVLFHSNKLKQFSSIGLLQSLVYMITHRKNPVYSFVHMLNKIHELEPIDYPILYYRNTPLPRCISDLLRGHINYMQATSIINAHLQKLIAQNHFQSLLEKRLMQKIIRILVEPQWSTHALKPNKKMVELIQKLKQNEYTVYLLTNFDKESYAKLLCTYPEIFALFDNIVVSSHIQMLKPYKEIYNYLLERYNLNASECLFIDDQKDNIRGAQAVDITGVHFTGTHTLLKELKKHNIKCTR